MDVRPDHCEEQLVFGTGPARAGRLGLGPKRSLSQWPRGDLRTFYTLAGALSTRTRNSPTPTGVRGRYCSAMRCLRPLVRVGIRV
jgi:hypothetical protein